MTSITIHIGELPSQALQDARRAVRLAGGDDTAEHLMLSVPQMDPAAEGGLNLFLSCVTSGDLSIARRDQAERTQEG